MAHCNKSAQRYGRPGLVIEEGATEIGGLVAWFKSDLYDAGFIVLNGGRMMTDSLELRLDGLGYGDADDLSSLDLHAGIKQFLSPGFARKKAGASRLFFASTDAARQLNFSLMRAALPARSRR